MRGAKPRGNLHLWGDRFVTLAIDSVRRRSPRPFGARDDKQAVIARSAPYSVIARGRSPRSNLLPTRNDSIELYAVSFPASMLNTEPAVMVRQFYVYILT